MGSTPLKKKPEKNSGWSNVKSGIVIAVVGLAIGAAGLSFAKEGLARRAWPQVSATLEDVEIDMVYASRHQSLKRPFPVNVTYSFKADGRDYRQTLTVDSFSHVSMAKACVDRIRSRPNFVIRYDPDDPNRSVHATGFPVNAIIFAGFGAMVCLLGGAMMFRPGKAMKK